MLAAQDLTPETAAHPVGPVPVNWRTIRKWQSGETGATAKKVRDTARAFGYSPTRALVEVGFLDANEAGIAGLGAMPSPRMDPVAREVNSSLTSQYVTQPARAELRRVVKAVYDNWFAAHRGADPPREANLRPRKGTKTPTK